MIIIIIIIIIIIVNYCESCFMKRFISRMAFATPPNRFPAPLSPSPSSGSTPNAVLIMLSSSSPAGRLSRSAALIYLGKLCKRVSEWVRVRACYG